MGQGKARIYALPFFTGGKMPDRTEYILELEGICKHFGNLTANDHISFKVRRGSVHAIIGENGAGKSTLMSILTCIKKQDSGRIIMNGKAVDFHSPKEASESGIGMVYQEFMLYKGMTVAENIIMGCERTDAGFLNMKKNIKKVEEICDSYDFRLPLKSRIDELPVSVLQQVEIVKVLYREAQLIIFDEPTSVLTPQGVRGLFKAMRELTGKGKTILFITHKLKEVLEIADHITVLKDGRVTADMKNENVSERELAKLMVGREVLYDIRRKKNRIGREVLLVKDLTVKDRKGILRLKKASFSVHSGEIVGIAGVAGAGQKELGEAIVGITRPEPGSEILLCGEPVGHMSIGERRKRGLGYVPQNRIKDGVNLKGSIWENTMMGYHLEHGRKQGFLIDFKDVSSFARAVVEDYSVKIQDISDRAFELSGGNIQKLIVGREMLQGKSFLIIEDPTRGIDVGAIELIRKKIAALSESGVGILLISHELSEVIQLSDRILVAYDKHIIEPEDSSQLTEEELGLLMTGGGQDENKIS